MQKGMHHKAKKINHEPPEPRERHKPDLFNFEVKAELST
jgi:hypothetical protein